MRSLHAEFILTISSLIFCTGKFVKKQSEILNNDVLYYRQRGYRPKKNLQRKAKIFLFERYQLILPAFDDIVAPSSCPQIYFYILNTTLQKIFLGGDVMWVLENHKIIKQQKLLFIRYVKNFSYHE
jgi:hypothetical protein